MKERFWDFVVGVGVLAVPLGCFLSEAFMACVGLVLVVVLAFLLGNLVRNM